VAGGDRVLVVGAGHNGLMCALRLAQAGLDVSVLEQAPTPGGAVASSEDTLPGFVHDSCSGFFPLTAASPAFRGLDLERHGLEWVNPDVPMAHPLAGGRAMLLQRDVGATARSLDAVAPGSAQAWSSFMGRLLPHAELMMRLGLEPFPPIGPAARLLTRLRRGALDLAPLMLGSAATMGLELFGHEAPTAWLCASTAHSDLSPGAAGGAAFAFVLHMLGHSVGWPFPRGGAGRLPGAMVARLEELGGRVRCGAAVERILCRGGRAVGVRLSGGEDVAADAVIATVSAGPFAAMLPDDALPGRLLRRLRRWRYGLGTFKLDWALSGPVPWEAAEARRAAVVHVAGTLDELFRSVEESGRGRAPAAPTLVTGQHTVHDHTRAPEGRHTLYAYARLPSDPDVPDEEIAERAEARIEAFAPGLRELILARSLRSPRRLERDNPSLVGGDLGGGTFELDQQLIFRPAPELVRYRTPLRGLYVAGTSVHPGPGVHGASGAGAAGAVLADRSGRRFWRR